VQALGVLRVAGRGCQAGSPAGVQGEAELLAILRQAADAVVDVVASAQDALGRGLWRYQADFDDARVLIDRQ
jgi:hypothetical protein